MPAFRSQSLRLSPSFKTMDHLHPPQPRPHDDHEAKQLALIGDQKQGISSILGSSDPRSSQSPSSPSSSASSSSSSSSLRRTLSADMSSRKWLSQNGFSKTSLAYIADSPSPSSEEEEECEGDQRKVTDDDNNLQGRAQFDIWSSIMSQKREESVQGILPPYVHPLVKRSASSLSEKSLEICTESLGSETGSDGMFSSYPPSETGEQEDRDDKVVDESIDHHPLMNVQKEEIRQYDDFGLPSSNKKKMAKSFPPPIPSLARSNGASVIRMQSRRRNGRLVLEAVLVPSQRNFNAQRRDGRLVLTFNADVGSDGSVSDERDELVQDDKEEEKDVEELDKEEFLGFAESTDDEKEEERVDEEEDEEEENDNELELFNRMEFIAMEEGAQKVSGGGGLSGDMNNNVHKIAIIKPMVYANRSPPWADKFSELAVLQEEQQPASIPIPQSLPPLGRMGRAITKSPPATVAATAAAASSLNAYEYFWRTKSTVAATATIIDVPSGGAQDSLALKDYGKNCRYNMFSEKLVPNEQQHHRQEEEEMILVKDKKNANCWVSVVKNCKDTRRRSFLFWEPHCIATT